MYFSSSEETVKWMEDCVERETAVARTRVQDSEVAIMHQLGDRTTADNVGATTRKPYTAFEEMLNAIEDGLSNLSSSDNEQDGEDKEDNDEDTEHGKLSDDDKTAG